MDLAIAESGLVKVEIGDALGYFDVDKGWIWKIRK